MADERGNPFDFFEEVCGQTEGSNAWRITYNESTKAILAAKAEVRRVAAMSDEEWAAYEKSDEVVCRHPSWQLFTNRWGSAVAFCDSRIAVGRG